jgi:hypothetical protein
LAQQIESDVGLGQQLIPQLHHKKWIGGARTSNEMILEGLDGMLYYNPLVHVRWGQLKINLLFCEESFECP